MGACFDDDPIQAGYLYRQPHMGDCFCCCGNDWFCSMEESVTCTTIEIQRTINGNYTLIQIEAYPAYWDKEILEFDVLQAWQVDQDREVPMSYSDIELTDNEIDAVWERLSE